MSGAPGANPLLLMLLASALSAPAAALDIRGTVFADANGNGTRDVGEPGLAGIRVSNGHRIVRTDEAGRYDIDIDDRRGHVMVLKPRGFALPRNEFGLPEYYWLHYPDGSPERRYAGIAPTGPVPASVDFALIPSEAPERLRVLLLADPQTSDRRELEFFERRFSAELRALEDIDLALFLGDQLNDVLDLAEPFDRVAAGFGHPWVAVIGNHDLDLDADSDFGAADTFTGRYGPATWAFELGPVHFLVLDNIRFYMPPSGQYAYHGGLRAEQLDFVQRYLADVPPQAMLVVAMHIPLSSGSFRDKDRERLLELLAPYDHKLLLAGHTHTNQHRYLTRDAAGGDSERPLHEYVVGTASGGWWGGELQADGLPHATMQDGTPPGYAVLDLTADGYSIRYHAVNQPGKQLALFGPGSVMAGTYPNAYVYANVFNGDRYTEVEYQIERLGADGEITLTAPWSAMRKVDEPDPNALRLMLERMQLTTAPDNPRMSPPRDSTHLWRTRLSTDVAPGRYRLSVRARDRWGMDALEQTEFRVYPRVQQR